ncbi:uncharacterized protein GGS25DRAFT_497377 [Hypoxylon fragiforme]|uniref:uncharacterized protein n=1 Tax=Hypoxylon fragiforme TaxID=63214 RepID=UPI0020C64744|nr:uncharacterized protein GGS25DRAFT_497377 [Hypoxylon fragiforme]KAI2607780.1 hypothetical protein GGS25DRAFT_497377 [Hypoxylon fragiforme]
MEEPSSKIRYKIILIAIRLGTLSAVCLGCYPTISLQSRFNFGRHKVTSCSRSSTQSCAFHLSFRLERRTTRNRHRH